MPALLQALPPWVVHSVFRAGELGVSVVFVLSGVVMVLTVQHLRFDGHNAARFVWRRLVRLWPPYAAAVALGVVMLLAKRWLAGSPAQALSAADVALHLVFCKTWLVSRRSRRFSGPCAWKSSSTSSLR